MAEGRPSEGAEHGVVVGAGIGYGYPQVRAFLTSLRATGFAGSIVLILDARLDAHERARIEAHGVHVVGVANNAWYVVANDRKAKLARGLLRSPIGQAITRRRSADARLHLQSASNRRFALYRELPDRLPQVFDQAPWAFLTDVRDVYFQRDPATAFGPLAATSGLHLFAEGPPPGFDDGPDGTFRIGEATSTIRWVRGLSDDATATELASRRVICSGTILATPAMMVELSERIAAALGVLVPGRATFGYDQGALNLLYYTGRLDDLAPVVHDNGTGGLATLGAIAGGPGWTAPGGEVEVNGEVAAVVHQYDRVPSLLEAWAPSS